MSVDFDMILVEHSKWLRMRLKYYDLWNKNIWFYQYLKRWRFCISQCFLYKIHPGIPYDDNDSLKNSLWWKNSRALISVALVKQKLSILRVISDLARKITYIITQHKIFDFDRSLEFHIIFTSKFTVCGERAKTYQ